ERLALKRSQLEEVYVERFAVTVEWFEEHHLGDYVAARGSVGAVAKSLYSEQAWIPLGSTAEEMRPYADELAGRVANAFDVIEAAYRGPRFPPLSAEELRRDGIEIDPRAGEIYELVAESIASGRRPPNPPGPARLGVATHRRPRRHPPAVLVGAASGLLLHGGSARPPGGRALTQTVPRRLGGGGPTSLPCRVLRRVRCRSHRRPVGSAGC